MIAESIVDLIGGTPMLVLNNLMKEHGIEDTTIIAKLEYLNPAGSAKDRVAIEMIRDAQACGKIKPGASIIEPTSGNTGIGLALAGAALGYRVILTLPDTMSEERRTLLKAYGAEIVLTDGAKGMAGAIEKAEELNREIEGSIILGQFDNPANAQAHFKTTGPEIWRETNGKADILIASVGTGGTITGTGEYLKSQNPQIKIIAVEPASSAVLSGKGAGTHKIQGIGAGFIPKVLNTSIYDEVIMVSDEDAFSYGKEVALKEGILVGISSGAVLAAAIEVAKRSENAGKNIIVILPDSGDRYLSTELFR